MSFLDTLRDGIERIIPAKRSSKTLPGGIAGGHAMIHPGEDMIVSKTAIVLHASEIFFDFIAMACFASVASFQAKWKVGPSGLTGFAIFISVISILLSLFLVLVPVLYEKYDKFVKLARALKEIRVAFILAATGVITNFLIAFIVTISAWTQPGCKNPDKDPNANKGDGFKKGLQSWCDTKKAGGIFFWLAFIFWLLSLGLLIRDWRQGASDRPRDPPFTHPPTSHAEAEDDEEGDEESMYQQPPPRSTTADNSNSPNSPFADTSRFGAPASRPSMDAYGAFSDPAPSGFGSSSPMANNRPPTLATPDTGPKVSRTMQYADPYAVVRAQLAAGASPSSPTGPPAYESYNEYR